MGPPPEALWPYCLGHRMLQPFRVRLKNRLPVGLFGGLYTHSAYLWLLQAFVAFEGPQEEPRKPVRSFGNLDDHAAEFQALDALLRAQRPLGPLGAFSVLVAL